MLAFFLGLGLFLMGFGTLLLASLRAVGTVDATLFVPLWLALSAGIPGFVAGWKQPQRWLARGLGAAAGIFGAMLVLLFLLLPELLTWATALLCAWPPFVAGPLFSLAGCGFARALRERKKLAMHP